MGRKLALGIAITGVLWASAIILYGKTVPAGLASVSDVCSISGTYEGCGGAYAPDNCTCYAWYRANEAGWNFPSRLCDDDLPCNAHKWNEYAEAHGYSVGVVPYVGSISVWEGNIDPANSSAGHVAYVTSVTGDISNTFQVDHMNLYGCEGYVFHSAYSTLGMGNNLHFIYPPSDTPVPLWPYSGLIVEYGDPIVLRWYGDAEYYHIQFEVQQGDSSGNLGPRGVFSWVFNVYEESLNLYGLESPEHLLFLVDGRWYWRICEANGVDWDCSSDWSEWETFDLENCIGIIGGGSAEGLGSDALTTDDDYYCCSPTDPNPTPYPTSTPFLTPGCPPENCTPGRDVGRDFFVEVVERLADAPLSDFAVDALVIWEPCENTLACWNPLATTWYMEGSCNFNSVGVKHYLSQDMGTQATANTLAQGYYDNIRRMLRLEEFNREGLRADLNTWGTCSGQSCNGLLDEWEALWNDQGGIPTPTPTNTPVTPSPADLKQASDLEFSPPDPSVGDTVHFWFKVRNDGGEAIEVTEIGPFGYGPNHTPWDANRHGNLEIAANGGEETIHGYRTFEEDEAGVWTVDGIHYQLVSDSEPRSYYDLPANGHRAAGMDVVVRGPSDLRQCLDLEIHPDPPIMLGEEVRFCTDLCNYGDQPSIFKYFGPEGRDPDDRNWDAFIEGSFSVPPDSHPYTYDMFGRYYKVGGWCIDRLAVQVNDNWLTRYTLPSDRHLQSFCFDVVADPDHLITFVEVIGSEREYRVVENLGVGNRYYTDRDYTILSLPKGFEDLIWIMTSNEDDQQTREEFLYFALNNGADVCIAHDQRVDPLPNWMDDFEDTGLFLEVGDSMASPLKIYCKHYPLGKVTLGGNLASGAGHSGPVSNYVVLAKTPCILLGDFDSSGHVNVLDIQQVASRWRMTDEDPDWDPRYDLNGDGIITVVDIMLVAARWGDSCPWGDGLNYKTGEPCFCVP